MKKQQKIIELRTAAKIKVAELKTKIAFAHSEAAKEHASLLFDRSSDLCRLEAGSTERFDVLAKYRAKIAAAEARRFEKTASLKFEIQQVKSECEKQCAAAEDDPETMREMPQQTVYCDGSEHSARIVARRLINKLPHIPDRGSISVNVIEDTYADTPEYFVSVSYGNRCGRESEVFALGRHTAELEAAFMEKVRSMFADEPDSGNSHVAEPFSGALDAVFGGNPVEQVDNLIADTVNDGKEADNE